jgi:hypothetical protein
MWIWGDFHPPLFHHPTNGASISLSPHAPCVLAGGVSRLPPYGIHGWVGIPQLATAAPEGLRKIMSAVKR